MTRNSLKKIPVPNATSWVDNRLKKIAFSAVGSDNFVFAP